MLGLSLSIIAFPMKKTFEEWRYRKSLDELSQALLQAKFISICYGTDCHVVLSQKGNGELEFSIESLEPLTPTIKKKHFLYGAKKVLSGSSAVNKISFFASGFHKPEEKVLIIPSKESLTSAEIQLSTPFTYCVDID